MLRARQQNSTTTVMYWNNTDEFASKTNYMQKKQGKTCSVYQNSSTCFWTENSC